MAQDGLLFRCFGRINRFTDTPVIATSVFGVLIAVAALVFDLDALIQMMSIGTLMAYTLVAISVLVLHYQREQVSIPTNIEVMHSRLLISRPNLSSFCR